MNYNIKTKFHLKASHLYIQQVSQNRWGIAFSESEGHGLVIKKKRREVFGFVQLIVSVQLGCRYD